MFLIIAEIHKNSIWSSHTHSADYISGVLPSNDIHGYRGQYFINNSAFQFRMLIQLPKFVLDPFVKKSTVSHTSNVFGALKREVRGSISNDFE